MLGIYYQTHSIYSHPGVFEPYFSEFPENLSGICGFIQNLFLHYADAGIFNVLLSVSRYQELNQRYLHQKLQNIFNDHRENLLQSTAPQDRLLGVCRDGALLLCAILRARGVMARLRAGFVNYVIPHLYLDTVFAEYFNTAQNRWILVDSRTSETLIKHYHLVIDFNLMDLDHTHFMSAARAWQWCRLGKMNPNRFGSRQKQGLLIIRNRLIHDLALLNKNELLIWDLWGLMLAPVECQITLMDELADLLVHHVNDTKRIQKFYNSHDILKVPNIVLTDNPFGSEQWSLLRGFSC